MQEDISEIQPVKTWIPFNRLRCVKTDLEVNMFWYFSVDFASNRLKRVETDFVSNWSRLILHQQVVSCKCMAKKSENICFAHNNKNIVIKSKLIQN